jgi:hypothetical protein
MATAEENSAAVILTKLAFAGGACSALIANIHGVLGLAALVGTIGICVYMIFDAFVILQFVTSLIFLSAAIEA